MVETAPWTIKSVPVETRQMAVRAAQAQDQTMGEWIAVAVERMANQQATNLVLPPGEQSHAPIVSWEPTSALDLAGIAAAIQATLAAAQAASSEPPKGLAREAATTIRAYLRAARGLPPRKTTQRNRQTTPLIGS